MSSSINSFIWLEQFIHLARTSPSINLLGSVFAFLSSDFFFSFFHVFVFAFFMQPLFAHPASIILKAVILPTTPLLEPYMKLGQNER